MNRKPSQSSATSKQEQQKLPHTAHCLASPSHKLPVITVTAQQHKLNIDENLLRVVYFCPILLLCHVDGHHPSAAASSIRERVGGNVGSSWPQVEGRRRRREGGYIEYSMLCGCDSIRRSLKPRRIGWAVVVVCGQYCIN